MDYATIQVTIAQRTTHSRRQNFTGAQKRSRASRRKRHVAQTRRNSMNGRVVQQQTRPKAARRPAETAQRVAFATAAHRFGGPC
jgi:hypothetical protein